MGRDFRPDLYKGTAGFYERFRLSYPGELFDDLLGRAKIREGGRLLDLACGTGQIAFGLCKRFGEVWAVDQEEEMIALGRAKAERLAIGNIRWITGRAEELAAEPGTFDLVAIGNAFHRLPRREVAWRARDWIVPGGSIALLWSYQPWSGGEPWQIVTSELMREWVERLGAADRVPGHLAVSLAEESNESVLAAAGFEVIGKFERTAPLSWTLESLAGFAYATSVLSPVVVGDRRDEFEADLRDRLLSVEPSGVFHDLNSFAYHLARRSDHEA